MISFSLVFDMTFFDNRMALVTDVFAHSDSLLLGVALAAQSASGTLDESGVGQRSAADLAEEAVRMPAGVHCLDHAADYELLTSVTAWCKQNIEVVFTVFTTFEFIEDSIRKWSEALCTYEALSVPHFTA
jgi:hypothetical protein